MLDVISVVWSELTSPVAPNLYSVVFQYIVFMTIGTISHVIYILAHKKWVGEITQPFDDFSYQELLIWAVIVFPAIEEVIFRGLPLLLTPDGSLLQWFTLAISTILWIYQHGRYGFVYASIGGLFFIKLWLSGLWIHAIVIHTVHNAIFLVLYYIQQEHYRK